MASVSTMAYQDTLDSQYLSSSISSLSRARSSNTLIVRAYKQATQLYLTKRFKESLETLEPIITPPPDPAAGGLLTDDDDDDDDDEEDTQLGNTHSTPHGAQAHRRNAGAAAAASTPQAPIAQSSRGTRTKVWVFYLSLLHAIIELGPEEGKLAFGSTRWRALAARAREGSVWAEVVRHGYGGREGDVDPDVVVNLATLLLGHMGSQRLTQQRLETYLSAAPDDTAQLLMMQQDGFATPMSTGTSSPKELTTRLKILELFTLHVLPANDEWEYAEQFIEMNELLDEERREAFLHALQSVKDEREALAQREEELQEMRERELEEQRAIEEQRRKDELRREEERLRAVELEKQQQQQRASAGSASKSGSDHPLHEPHPQSPLPPRAPGSATSDPRNGSGNRNRSSKPPANLLARASVALNSLQQMIMHASRNVSGNNMAMMRALMFVIAFLILVARRDLRDRLKRTMNDGWIKVKQTVGMGVKVSYI